MFQKLRMIILTVIAGLIGICCLVSVSYAYYTVNPIIISAKEVLSENDLSVVLFDNKPISIFGEFALPISDINAIYSAKQLNRLKLINETGVDTKFKLYIVPTNNSNIPDGLIKYSI